MELNRKNWDDFAHARWRVQFLRHLLQAHQAAPQRTSASWTEEEAEYTNRLADAALELERYPKAWHTLPKSEIPVA